MRLVRYFSSGEFLGFTARLDAVGTHNGQQHFWSQVPKLVHPFKDPAYNICVAGYFTRRGLPLRAFGAEFIGPADKFFASPLGQKLFHQLGHGRRPTMNLSHYTNGSPIPQWVARVAANPLVPRLAMLFADPWFRSHWMSIDHALTQGRSPRTYASCQLAPHRASFNRRAKICLTQPRFCLEPRLHQRS